MTRKVLGRGLSALIPQKQAEQPPLLELEIQRIVPSPAQPRKEFAEERLKELSQSIRAKGLIQPVIVRPLEDGRYELIAGERRWRAARAAGLEKVPVVVRSAAKEEAFELALIENLQREDLNPIETARAYQTLIDTYGLSHEEVASRVGKDRSSVTNHLRLLGLPQEIQDVVSSGALSMGHARAILGIPRVELQIQAKKLVISKGLSVRETERLVKRLSRPPSEKTPEKLKKDIYINQLEDSIRRALGTKVNIRHRGSKGVIELHYFSSAELDRLIEHLRGKGTP